MRKGGRPIVRATDIFFSVNERGVEELKSLAVVIEGVEQEEGAIGVSFPWATNQWEKLKNESPHLHEAYKKAVDDLLRSMPQDFEQCRSPQCNFNFYTRMRDVLVAECLFFLPNRAHLESRRQILEQELSQWKESAEGKRKTSTGIQCSFLPLARRGMHGDC
jgi:hypothetical protein